MSIQLMTQAWKSPLPAGMKMVLLALCDNANDMGECYPSISTIAVKCSMGERTVQRHITDMEELKIIWRELRKGRSTVYHIYSAHFDTSANLAPLSNLAPTSAKLAPTPPPNSTKTSANLAPITIKEPSIESSEKRNTARGTRLPTDWLLPKAWGDWALKEFPGWNKDQVRGIADKFRDHWIALSGSKAVKADWFATWRNWCRNESVPAKAASGQGGSWWASDSAILAKGMELGLRPQAGESMPNFKGRIESAIARASVPVAAAPPPPVPAAPVGTEKKRTKPEGLNLKSLVGRAPKGFGSKE